MKKTHDQQFPEPNLLIVCFISLYDKSFIQSEVRSIEIKSL